MVAGHLSFLSKFVRYRDVCITAFWRQKIPLHWNSLVNMADSVTDKGDRARLGLVLPYERPFTFRSPLCAQLMLHRSIQGGRNDIRKFFARYFARKWHAVFLLSYVYNFLTIKGFEGVYRKFVFALHHLLPTITNTSSNSHCLKLI